MFIKTIQLCTILAMLTIGAQAYTSHCLPLGWTIAKTDSGILFGVQWCAATDSDSIQTYAGEYWIAPKIGNCSDGYCAHTGCIISKSQFDAITKNNDSSAIPLASECTEGKLGKIDLSGTEDRLPPSQEKPHPNPSTYQN